MAMMSRLRLLLGGSVTGEDKVQKVIGSLIYIVWGTIQDCATPRTQRAELPAPASRWGDGGLQALVCPRLRVGPESQRPRHAASGKGTAACGGAPCTRSRP